MTMNEEAIKPSQPEKRRRSWSTEEKQAILAEAEAAGFSSTSRKHGVELSLLFQWRKKLSGAKTVKSNDNITTSDELRAEIIKIRKLDTQVDKLLAKLDADLDTGKLTAYNVANAFSSLTKSFCQLVTLKLDTIQKLEAHLAIEPATKDPEEIEPTPEESRMAERLVYALVKEQVEQDKKLKLQRAQEAKENVS